MARRKSTDDEPTPEEWQPYTEEEPVDLDNLDAIFEATKPVQAEYNVELVSGKTIRVEFYVQGQVASMEALKGMDRLKDSDKIKPSRERAIYVRRMNPHLINIQLIDKPHTKPFKDDQGRTVIPLESLSIRGYLELLEAVFPGSHDQGSDISARVDAARSQHSKGVPRQNPEPSAD